VASNGKAKTVVMAAAPAEDVWVYASSDGSVLVSPRSGKSPSSVPLRLADTSALVSVVAARSDRKLLMFTEQGLAVRASLSDHTVARSGAGKLALALTKDDRLAVVFSGGVRSLLPAGLR
jgi:DNA gyrase/topoisomerase IV subunit A